MEEAVIGIGDQLSEGGEFSVSGSTTASEPVPVVSGGSFSIEGTFSGTPGDLNSNPVRPSLHVTIFQDQLELKWTSSDLDEFVLEESSELGIDASWTKVPQATVFLKGENKVRLKPESGNHFYRLRSRKG